MWQSWQLRHRGVGSPNSVWYWLLSHSRYVACSIEKCVEGPTGATGGASRIGRLMVWQLPQSREFRM